MVSEDDPIERCIATLGEPDAHYSINPAGTRTKFILGCCLFVGGLAAIYLFFAIFPAQFGGVLAKLLFVPPGVGVILLYHLIRTRGLHVLVYPSGVFRFQRGAYESYPWAEIDEVRLKGEAPNINVVKDDAGTVAHGLIELIVPRFTIWNAQIILKRKDNVTCKLTAVLENFDELAETVQIETFLYLWPTAWESFKNGKSVNFGILDIDQTGISKGKKSVAWAEVKSIRIENKMLMIRRNRKWKSVWGAFELSTILNPHVLFALLNEQGIMIREEEE